MLALVVLVAGCHDYSAELAVFRFDGGTPPEAGGPGVSASPGQPCAGQCSCGAGAESYDWARDKRPPWTFYPPSLGIPELTGRFLYNQSAESVAMVDGLCEPLLFGGRVELTVLVSAAGAAKQELQVLLGLFSDPARTKPDTLHAAAVLAIHIRGDGFVDVLGRDGHWLSGTRLAPGEHQLVLELVPDKANDHLSLFLRDPQDPSVVGDAPVAIGTADLVQLGRCSAAGLRLGFVLKGNNVGLGPVTIRSGQCPNPGGFEGRAARSLPLPDWAQGGLGSPALVGLPESASGPSWFLFADGTRSSRSSPNDEPFSIGQSLGSGDSSGDLRWEEPGVSILPCSQTDCGRSAREPSVLAREDGAGFIVAHALESGNSPAYALAVREIGWDGVQSAIRFQLVPGQAPWAAECQSLTGPSLVAKPNAPGHILVFFTCRRPPGEPSEIRVMALSPTFVAEPVSGALGLVAAALDQNTRGLGGLKDVSDPEVVVGPESTEYWLWFMGVSGGERSIWVATARGEPANFQLLRAGPAWTMAQLDPAPPGITRSLEGFTVAELPPLVVPGRFQRRGLLFLIATLETSAAGQSTTSVLHAYRQWWRER